MSDRTRPIAVDGDTALKAAEAALRKRPRVRRIGEAPGAGRLGRHLYHDPRSRSFSALAAATVTSRLHRHYGPVLDQGQLGSCTGNALTQALMCHGLFKRARRLTEDTAVALYSRATELDPFDGFYPPTDTGSAGLFVCKAAVEAGLITSYDHAFGLDHALSVLVLRPVIIGMSWMTGCDDPEPSGLIRWSGRERGGHEVCLNGVDVRHRVVRGINSWGPSWGKAGAFYMTWDDLGAALAADGDCTVPVP